MKTKERSKDHESEELKTQLEKCVLCGLCNSVCPVFKTLHMHEFSPRGKIAMFKLNLLYEELIYACTLCKACELNCPNDVKLTELILEARKKKPKGEELMKNLKKFDNAIGKSNEWYCC